MLLNAHQNKLISQFEDYIGEELVFESNVAGTYSLNLAADGIYEIACVGGSGAAAIRGVYDDKGYGWGGGSGAAFAGTAFLSKKNYSIVVGAANTNTKGQGGNSNTLNPADTTIYPSSISSIITCGGGASGTTSGVGAGGSAPVLNINPITTLVNSAGNPGKYNYGGKGSSWPPATCEGGASVYEGHGKGQGCVTSEYASSRRWIAGTSGYVKIKYIRPAYTYIVEIRSNTPNAIITMNGIQTNRLSVIEGTVVNYTVSAEGYTSQSGNVRALNSDKTININLVKSE